MERLEASGALVYHVNGALKHGEQTGTLRVAGKKFLIVTDLPVICPVMWSYQRKNSQQ